MTLISSRTDTVPKRWSDDPWLRKDSIPEDADKIERNSNSNHCVTEEMAQEMETKENISEKNENPAVEKFDDEKYLKRKNSTKEMNETEIKAETVAAILDSRLDLHASLSTQDRGF